MPLRVVFMGTPDFSVPVLSAILAAEHQVVAAYSQPPRPAGRGMEERKSPVHVRAEQAGIPVLTPRTLRTPEAAATFRDHAADIAVVVAYGLILPRSILEAPRHGCLNLHASALPRWRGAAPIQRAIIAGDSETAVMVMQMEEGLDTGPVCMTERLVIDALMTAGELHDALSVRGAALMVRALAALEQGKLASTPQSTEGVTYARKIEKEEAHIDFSRPANEVHNHIRGLSPFPGAWFEVGPPGKAERIKVMRSAPADASASGHAAGEVLASAEGLVVACGDSTVRLDQLQRAGKKPMSSAELLRGYAIPPGTRLR